MSKRQFILYHWAPKSRRQGIKRRGLVIGSRHSVHSQGWRATYLCFSDSPSFGWAYSAATTHEEQEWDLWMVWSGQVDKPRRRSDHTKQKPAEWRTKQSIPREHVHYVATRLHKPRGRSARRAQ